MTVEVFNRQMDRLSGLRFRPADLTTHWEALQDMPDEALEAAVTRSQRTRVEFPTPVELRMDADLARVNARVEEEDRTRRTPLSVPREFDYPLGGGTIVVRDEWRYDCEDCSDRGWAPCWCGDIKALGRRPWYEIRTCDRRDSHYPHEWVRKCPCAETNPTIRRRAEAAKRYAAEKASKGR